MEDQRQLVNGQIVVGGHLQRQHGLGRSEDRIAGLFDDDIPEELPEPGAGRREASSNGEKAGIKSLGGAQVRVAGDGGAAGDISGLWQDAPDVSRVFH